MVVCIAGKNEIAVNALNHLLKGHHGKLLACINKTDDGINGWQPSFAFHCKKNNVPVVTLDEVYGIEDLVFFSLEYDRIIKPEKFSSKQLYNIHFSKLPAYKGMYTSVTPLLNGEGHSGVTLHKIDKGIDTGDIIDQQVFDLSPDTTARELYDLYLFHGFNLFIKNLDALLSNRVEARPQPATGSTYYSRQALDFARIEIDLNKTAYQIHNQVRAFTFRDYQLPRVNGQKVYRSKILPAMSTGKPGALAHQDDYEMVFHTVDYQLACYIDKEEELVEVARTGDILRLKHLKDHEYPLDIRTRQGWDALIIACYHNQGDFVKHLVEKESWDVNTCNYKGTTALMYAMTAASQTGDLTTLQYLSDKCDWSRKDDRGRDIYSYAREYGNEQVIRFVEQALC